VKERDRHNKEVMMLRETMEQMRENLNYAHANTLTPEDLERFAEGRRIHPQYNEGNSGGADCYMRTSHSVWRKCRGRKNYCKIHPHHHLHPHTILPLINLPLFPLLGTHSLHW
jgi:hypothetical protein